MPKKKGSFLNQRKFKKNLNNGNICNNFPDGIFERSTDKCIFFFKCKKFKVKFPENKVLEN